jgi:hypothetical protein
MFHEFAETVRALIRRRGKHDLTVSTELFPFFDHYYDDVYRYIKTQPGVKARISITGRLGSGTNFDMVIRRLFAISDLIVFSPGAMSNCHASAGSRFTDLTEDGHAILGRDKRPGHAIRFDMNPGLLDALGAASSLIEARQLLYLPGYAINADINGWSYPGEAFGDPYSDDPFERQLRRIAQEIYVSQRLGCAHVFPSAMDAPQAFATDKAVPNVIGLALGRIRIPVIESCGLDVLARIKEEEHQSFMALQSSVIDAMQKLAAHDLDIQRFDTEVDRIQREIIDAPLSKVIEKVRRLQRYAYFRTAGYAVATAGLVVATFLSPSSAALLTGALGSVSVLKIYEETVRLFEQREGAIKDSERAYLCRISGV